MKRFYKLVSTAQEGDGWAILLDGKPVNTPAKNQLIASSQGLANALVQEWAGQEESIVPESMPLTQIASTKIDRVSAEREAMSETLLKYVNTDLLCYRTEEPEEMAKAQEDAWGPWLTWFADEYGCTLQTTTSLTSLEQDHAAHMAISSVIKSLSDDEFTVFQLVSSIAGSLVLAMAFMAGRVSAQEVFDTARVEEHFKAALYNEEKYGPDPAQEKKDQAALADLEAAQTYLRLATAE